MDNNLNTSQMKFEYIDKAGCYTGNNLTNKSMRAIKTHKILSALMENNDNLNSTIRQLNAYDAASILTGEANWIKHNHFNKYMPSLNSPNKIQFGQVCTVDYGKTYKGEIGYIHPGLCIGKKEHKYLIIPMTTGQKWREQCYHPINNPSVSKKHRQALVSEGFKKDGVLLISDTKFISGGRILQLHEVIDNDILNEIQYQVFSIMFPNLYFTLKQLQDNNTKLENSQQNMQNQIKNLKLKNEKLEQKVIELSQKLAMQ